MNNTLDLNSTRAQEARLSKSIGNTGFKVLAALSIFFGLASIGSIAAGSPQIGILLIAPCLIFLLPAVWWKQELSKLPPTGNALNEILSGDVLSRLKPGMVLDPQTMWSAINDHWQAGYLVNHLLLTSDLVGQSLSTDPADLDKAFDRARAFAEQNKCREIELVFVAAGLMLGSESLAKILIGLKAQQGDIESIANWMGRNISQQDMSKNKYGGIARDWTFGFTPLLNRLGHNLTQEIMNSGGNYGWITESESVASVETSFDNRSVAVALIGEDGIGKTTTAHALAQRLIEGDNGRSLAYHQVVALNATDITSNAQAAGELEQIMIRLANEASHAGHIILFFDNAQLFFGGGPGTFDATQILLSIIEARSAPIIMALTPGDYQRLKAQNAGLANLLTPVVMKELDETGVMVSLENACVGLENSHNVLIAYEALREAYRLSGRYDQEQAYPGKAIKLLEQSIAHSDNALVTANSVQKAIEQTRGVKVSTANTVEADTLLNLEDKIHERMINQVHAVGVVSNALRRARAGVANPRRPIGSFLFLGPTGVGKTELAKAIASTYFGSQDNMVRLDMSEYQQPADVSRLLSNGAQESGSLIMAVREQPFSVVLLDEIEKAHPNVLNLLLQLFDEGQLTDSESRPVSFKDCIIIVTSNAGAQTIRQRVEQGQTLESFSEEFTNELINSGQFKPELLNRFDEIVLFGPLKPEELAQVVALMMGEINQTLANQNISVELTESAVAKIVATGYDPRLGARPMRRTLQKAVEDTVAQKILKNEIQSGDHVKLDVGDLAI